MFRTRNAPYSNTSNQNTLHGTSYDVQLICDVRGTEIHNAVAFGSATITIRIVRLRSRWILKIVNFFALYSTKRLFPLFAAPYEPSRIQVADFSAHSHEKRSPNIMPNLPARMLIPNPKNPLTAFTPWGAFSLSHHGLHHPASRVPQLTTQNHKIASTIK